MREEITPKAAQEIMKNLLTTMRNCKKLLDSENKMFDTKGVASLNEGRAKVLENIQKFDQLYKQVIDTKNLKQHLPEDTLKMAALEYDLFVEAFREYGVNLSAVVRINEILMDSIKTTMASSAKHDMGYNKQGKFVSDKTVLSIMPSVTFNSKV